MRRILILIAIVIVICQFGTVKAGSIVVETASGSIGGITLTNEGITAGVATIEISKLPNAQSFLNTVNGNVVPSDPVAVMGPITMLVTPGAPGFYSLALSPPTYEAAFGTTPGAQGVLAFNQSQGIVPLLLPTVLNMSGKVTSVVSNLEPTYDFSKMAGGDISFVIAGSTFTGTTSFAGLFDTPGSSATGNGSFSLVAIPEPSSVALMGMGMGVIFAMLVFGRLRKPRTSIAA